MTPPRVPLLTRYFYPNSPPHFSNIIAKLNSAVTTYCLPRWLTSNSPAVSKPDAAEYTMAQQKILKSLVLIVDSSTPIAQ